MNTIVHPIFVVFLLTNAIHNSESSLNCITKGQQIEIPTCCQMEPLVPKRLLTKCEELAAAVNNP
uniref:Uncharacterized protein n=1 Tax=Anopheles minimus TaxID=112268 RepID=A0A182WQ38_9DIPT